eukprot:4173-Heterococcus_DN1.PRE.3
MSSRAAEVASIIKRRIVATSCSEDCCADKHAVISSADVHSVAQRILLSPAAIITTTTANAAVTAVTASISTAATATGGRLCYFATSDRYLFQATLSAASALRLRLCIMRCPPYHCMAGTSVFQQPRNTKHDQLHGVAASARLYNVDSLDVMCAHRHYWPLSAEPFAERHLTAAFIERLSHQGRQISQVISAGESHSSSCEQYARATLLCTAVQ